MDAAPRSTARFVAVAGADALDEAWARSHAGPVVLFNFDPG